MNPLIKKFATANLFTALKMIRCGFELETQSMNGETISDGECYCDTDYDWVNERANDLADDSFDCLDFEEAAIDVLTAGYSITKYASLNSVLWPIFRQNLTVPAIQAWESMKNEAAAIYETRDYTKRNLMPLEYAKLIDAAANERYQEIFEDCENVAMDDYWAQHECPGYGSGDFPSIPNIEYQSDESVEGPEITTVGALSVSDFSKALRQVTSHRLEVDEGCSFHVHLSIPGLQHRYGENLAVAIMDYFLSNWNELPKRVRERLATGAYRYCEFKLYNNKFRFVNWHSQGTLEFRLFGNINTHKEGMKCLLMAVRALQHAYQVVHLKTAKRMLSEAALKEALHNSDILGETYSGVAFVNSSEAYAAIKRQYKRKRKLESEAA